MMPADSSLNRNPSTSVRNRLLAAMSGVPHST